MNNSFRLEPKYVNICLHGIYEGGLDFIYCCEKLGLSYYNYDRHKARELITSYINLYLPIEENSHPLLISPYPALRQLVDYLQQESKGIKIQLYNEQPSLF